MATPQTSTPPGVRCGFCHTTHPSLAVYPSARALCDGSGLIEVPSGDDTDLAACLGCVACPPVLVTA